VWFFWQSLISTQYRLVITSSGSDSSTDIVGSDVICIEVPTDDIRVGDSLLVFPGETIPVDVSQILHEYFSFRSLSQG